MSKKKYTLVESNTVTTWDGRKLFRIKAEIAIAALRIEKGDLGGYVESEANLSQVSGDAWVYGDARVSGNAWVYGKITVGTRSDGYTFLIAPTPDGPRIIAGCRYFTFDEARAHWTKTRGGTQLGEESLALVDHLERMAKIRGFMEPVTGETA